MQNFFAIDLLSKPENLLFSPGNPPVNINGPAIRDQRFESFLLKQLDDIRTRHSEENQSYNIDKNPASKILHEKKEPVNNLESQSIAYSKNSSKTDEKNEPIKNENINNKDNNINKNTSENIEQNDKIKKKISEDISKSKEKIPGEKILNGFEISSLLKDIDLMLEIIKNLSLNKKEMQEIKSIFSEFRDNILINDKDIALNWQLKGLLGKLKKFFETASEHISLKNSFLQKNENKNGPFESLDIKKQISKLIQEIRQHLNDRKSETAAGKNEDFININKNAADQKILSEYSDNERKEISSGKDNTSNFNFQFSKKTIEGNESLSIKNDIAAAQKKNAFNEQLNNIIQNAKIFIKDSKNGSFSIRLYPETLGRVNVNLNLEHGVILGKFLVDNVEAKEVLLDNIFMVKERLQENGVAVGEFQVNVRGEDNPFTDFNKDRAFYNTTNRNISPGNEYELYSSYLHDGEIDLII